MVEKENGEIKDEAKKDTNDAINDETPIDSKNDTSVSEDNLEISKLKFKDKIRAKIERFKNNTADMSRKEKIKYFIYYYKWKLLLLVLLLFCTVSIPMAIYKHSRPVALSYVIINNADTNKVNTEPIDDYLEFYDIKKNHQVLSNSSHVNLDDYKAALQNSSTSADYEQFPTLCINGYYDVIITDIKGIEFCKSADLIQPLNNVLSADMQYELEEKYKEKICGQSSEHPDILGYYLDISDTEFAKGLGLSYDKIYLCFPGSTDDRQTNAKRVIKFAFMLDCDI